MNIAILGNGHVGKQLHSLLDNGKNTVYLCSREPSKAHPGYAQGAADAEVIFLTVPFSALAEVLPPLREALRGKIVVDCTNPLNPDWSPLLLGQENSAGEETARLLPDSYIVKAFNTIFADVMTPERQLRSGLRSTAFIAGDAFDAKKIVIELAKNAGFEPLDVGPLSMARYLEAMAHLNIQIAIGQKGGTNAAFIYHQIRA